MMNRKVGLVLGVVLVVVTTTALPTQGDIVAGTPGSISAEYPEVPFGLPCDDGMGDTVSPSPSVSPSASTLYRPLQGDIAYEVVSVIRELCRSCGCGCHNLTKSEILEMATSIWKAYGTDDHGSTFDPCPKFLEDNPTFPFYATPTPVPRIAAPALPAKTDPVPEHVAQRLRALARQRESLAEAAANNEPIDADRVDVEKKFDSALATAHKYVTTDDEMKSDERFFEPISSVPADCGDDDLGSVGLSNGEVSGTGSGMNSGYKPFGAIYAPKGGKENLKDRENLIGARDLESSFLEQPASKCTIYESMKITESDPIETILGLDSFSECEESCLFDDDCSAWSFQKHNGKCLLFQNSDRLQLVQDLKNVFVSAVCSVAASSAPNKTLPKCENSGIFNAGFGDCRSYSTMVEVSNHNHCEIDVDKRLELSASQACPQCNKCAPTPDPTPMIPAPKHLESFLLPDGSTTPCLSARRSSLERLGTGPLSGSYTPQCFLDGSFLPTQCDTRGCFCVFETGVEIPNTREELSAAVTIGNIRHLDSCRDPPLMDPVTPPKYNGTLPLDRTYQAIRILSKILYRDLTPVEYCRRDKNATMENLIISALVHKMAPTPTRNATEHSLRCNTREHNNNTKNDMTSTLTTIGRCLVAPLKQSPSPTASPSASMTPSVSMTPSPSVSPAVAMCGDVSCASRGLKVSMYAHVPTGWCDTCVEGTSGPCRNKQTYECSGFMYGDSCHHDSVRCEHIGSVVPPVLTRLDCPPISNQVTLSARLTVPISVGADWVRVWQTTLSSAIADVLGGQDLCLTRVLRVEPIGDAARLTVGITRPTVEEAETDVNRLLEANKNGEVLTTMAHRGIPTTN